MSNSDPVRACQDHRHQTHRTTVYSDSALSTEPSGSPSEKQVQATSGYTPTRTRWVNTSSPLLSSANRTSSGSSRIDLLQGSSSHFNVKRTVPHQRQGFLTVGFVEGHAGRQNRFRPGRRQLRQRQPAD